MTQDYIAFPTIVSEIGRMCKQRATGTLFIVTKANKSVQMVLDKGEIIFIYFSSKRGQEALALMSTIQAGRYRFQEGGVMPRRMQLPPTETILATLGNTAEQLSTPGLTNDKKPLATGSELSQKQEDVLRSCLAECIGPMAAIICEDHFRSRAELNVIIESLAAEIPSSSQAEKFKEMVRAKLR